MNFSRIGRALQLAREDPLALKYLAIQAAWSIKRAPARPLPLSWRLPANKLAETSIGWPTPVPLPDARWWENKFRVALAAHVPVLPTTIAHPFRSILMFDARLGNRTHRIAIDYRDDSEISVGCATSVALYFKLQYSNEGYPYDNIFPGGYVVKQQNFYNYLPRLRVLKNRESIFEVYGRFTPRGELRKIVIDCLQDQNMFEFSGGLGIALYVQSIWEAARAKISVDLPGYGSFCYRLPEYLAIGSCVVALPHANSLHVPLEDRKHVAFTRPKGADLIELCRYYLEHEIERETMVRNSREYFDRYLHYRQLGAYYLATIFERLP